MSELKLTNDTQPRVQLLTVAEVMADMRISRTGLYRLFNAGELAWVQVGAHRRVSSAEVSRYITEHTQLVAS